MRVQRGMTVGNISYLSEAQPYGRTLTGGLFFSKYFRTPSRFLLGIYINSRCSKYGSLPKDFRLCNWVNLKFGTGT